MEFLLLVFLSTSINAFSSDSPSTILFIGDSISYGKFGQVIDSNLRNISKSVVSEASCGSTPTTWLTAPGQTGHSYAKTVCGFWRNGDTDERAKEHLTPKLEEELQNLHPKVTIVQLGTNIAASEHPENARASVHQMMEKIRLSGSQCIWIGPPDANSPIVTREKLRATDEIIKQEASAQGCYFIDTLAFTQFPAGSNDGIHPSPSLAETWANQVSQIMTPFVTHALSSPYLRSNGYGLQKNGNVNTPSGATPAR